VFAARLAGIRGAIANAVMLGDFAALVAISHAAGIALLADIGQASGVIRKLVIEVSNRVAQLFGDALFNFHGCLT
jgi:hypothetical protein